MNNMIKKKATGKKKQREAKPIDDTLGRQVTFSKRRVGVFKKASELCVLTGAEGAVLCESVGGRVYAFGHPSVEHVVDKFLGTSENNSAATESYVNSSCMHEELKNQYLEITKEMEIEKSKSVNVIGGTNDKFNKNTEEGDFWWQQPFDHLKEEELEEYISSMEKLMYNLKLRANDLRLIRTSSSMFDASNTLNSNNTGSSDEYLENKNRTTKDYYGLSDEFSANENVTKQDYGVPHEFSTKKDLCMKGYGLPDEFFTNKKLNSNADGLLNELLAINDSDFNNELGAFITDLELPDDCGNNVQVPNFNGNTSNQVQLSHINVNLVAPDDYGSTVDLHKFDTTVLPDFSFLCLPK